MPYNSIGTYIITAGDQAHLKKLERPDYLGRSISKAMQYAAEHA